VRFNYKGSKITLIGVKDCTATCLLVKKNKLQGMIRKWRIAQLVELTTATPTTGDNALHPDIDELIQ
jgi:hypothetical protein